MGTLRVVLRGLGRSPLFALVATLSLALGIGSNTAMFSLLDQMLLRQLPVRNPQERANTPLVSFQGKECQTKDERR